MVKTKTINFVEENIGINLHNHEVGKIIKENHKTKSKP